MWEVLRGSVLYGMGREMERHTWELDKGRWWVGFHGLVGLFCVSVRVLDFRVSGECGDAGGMGERRQVEGPLWTRGFPWVGVGWLGVDGAWWIVNGDFRLGFSNR